MGRGTSSRRRQPRPYVDSESGDSSMDIDVHPKPAAPPSTSQRTVEPGEREMRRSKQVALENRVWNSIAPGSRVAKAAEEARLAQEGRGRNTASVTAAQQSRVAGASKGKGKNKAAVQPTSQTPSTTSKPSSPGSFVNDDIYMAPDIDCDKSDTPEPKSQPSGTNKVPAGKIPGKRISAQSIQSGVEHGGEESSESERSNDDDKQLEDEFEEGEGGSESSSSEDSALMEKNPTQLALMFDSEEPMFVDQEYAHDDNEDTVEIPDAEFAPPKHCGSSSQGSSTRATSQARSTSASVPPTSPLPSSPSPVLANPAAKRSRAIILSSDEEPDMDDPPLKKTHKNLDKPRTKSDQSKRKSQQDADKPKKHTQGKDKRRAATGDRVKSAGVAKDDRAKGDRTKSDRAKESRHASTHSGLGKHGSTRKGAELASSMQSSKPIGKSRKVDEEPEFREIEDNSVKPRAPTESRKAEKHTRAKAAVSKNDNPESDSLTGGDSEDDSIDLVYPTQGGKLGLLDQHRRVRRATRGAMARVTAHICIKNAFPAEGLAKHNDLSRRALVKEAEELDDNQLARKIKKDDDYGMELAAVVSQRIANLRNPVKRAADNVVATAFGIKQGDNEKCVWLQAGLRFIYPHNYEDNTVDGTKPFENPLFANLLQSLFFKRKNSQGNKVKHLFTSSLLDKPNELEIPAPMLALVATGLFAGLEDYRPRVRTKVNDFTGDHYGAAYAEVIDTLNMCRNDGPTEYHVLMHNLYLNATGQAGTASAQPSGAPRISFLQVKGMRSA